jgi:ribosomal protein S18 acetylase RimI-like enzyme
LSFGRQRIGATMDDILHIPSPAGPIRLRPERDDDRDFRYQLFCDSRQPELALLPAPIYQQIMAQQFHAQAVGYRGQFPQARFDIIELDGECIGRIVIDLPGTMVHIVDQALVPARRGHGIGTAILRALMSEAQAAGLPLRLAVASDNAAALRLYLRLGFAVIDERSSFMRVEWSAPKTTS